ncbi:class I SAM-dependent methyltransferase [Rubrivirga sp. IMCC45206]|uniref:class I SAM-dependent methyltransferase n=1 Tax=Rubrivirga sp. IMCC45206 TaxID=3391614 RepID=UPI00398FA000
MWYDLFSLVYDRALEDLYAPFRPAAVEPLRLSDGAHVLDLPCGTGQCLDLLAAAVGPTGAVLGVDASRGMLRQARRRIERAGWDTVALRRARAADVDADLLAGALGQPDVDALLCALGLTALPAWEAAFERLFARLRPGGRFVLFDVYAPERTREARAVELVARADLSREAWGPLAARCDDFEREVLSDDAKTFGGELYVASGTKGATSA